MNTTEGSSTTRSNVDPAEAASEFVTVAEFAKAWNRSRWSVLDWIRAGKVAGAYREQTPGGLGPWRIPRSALPAQHGGGQ